ncbi:MAG: DMT family transporter [Clostridia bacterium]|nr:DMT family transporter [Clostridia bacterium]
MYTKSIRGSLLLLLGAVIWGAAFAAQRMGMEHMPPFTFTGVRMLLAGIVILPLSLLMNRKGEASRRTPEGRTAQRKAGMLCGLLLFAATSLQQAGLVYTSAGKAGFVTALYVVLVPVAGLIFLKKKTGGMIWAGVGLAVIALYLLCVPADGFRIETGDGLVLGCAVCFTGQILCVDYYAPKTDPLKLARDEFLITGGLSMIIAVCTEEIRLDAIRAAAIPILYTGILSGAVGYTLQIMGQREVNPTIASLIMCLESVFAVLTGVVLLGEQMTGREAVGCVLMFAAVILAQLSTAMTNKKIQKGKTHETADCV